MKCNLPMTALPLLVLVFGAGCSSGDGTSASDSGSAGSDGTAADGANPGDGANPDDGANAGDSSLGDEASTGDGASPEDSGNIHDSGVVSDAAEGPDAPDSGRPSPVVVDLGAAGNFVILAKSAISTVPTSAVTGDLGISPAAAAFITGFSLTANATNVFSTSPQVTGKVYAANYASPTPSNITTAVGDMMTAFTSAAGRPASVTGLGAGNIGGMTLSRGVYAWGTALLIPTNLTLVGSATDVWISRSPRRSPWTTACESR